MTAERRRRSSPVLGFSLVAAPLLMLLADALALTAPGRVTLVTVLLWLAFYVFIGAAIGMADLAGGTRTAITGAALTVFGCLIGGTIMGLERMSASMLRHGIASDLAVEVMSDPAVFLTSRAPGLAFPLGLLVLTFVLFRAEVLAPARAVILAVGVMLFPVGRIGALPSVNAVGDVAMLLVVGGIGLRWLRAGPGAAAATNETEPRAR